MSTVFIGGSRHISRLSTEAKERLQNIVGRGFQVILGDANGADKAVQKYLLDAAYNKVTVFCSGGKPRNNLGHWEIQSIVPEKAQRGFHFYAAKDRAMAARADYGLMIWDGKSPGTALNVLRLIQAGKKAVLLNVPEKKSWTLSSAADWNDFLSRCGDQLVADLRERATSDEWAFPGQHARASGVGEMAGLGVQKEIETPALFQSEDELTAKINQAFARGDTASVVNLLGSFAKARGMSSIATEAGLSRESLYRSLSADGNPEFSTILKVVAALGFRLSVDKAPNFTAT